MNFLRDIKLTKKHFILLGIAVIAFVGWRVVSVLKPPATEKRTVPVVRTMTVGETVADGTATYPGEVRGKYESNLVQLRIRAKCGESMKAILPFRQAARLCPGPLIWEIRSAPGRC